MASGPATRPAIAWTLAVFGADLAKKAVVSNANAKSWRFAVKVCDFEAQRSKTSALPNPPLPSAEGEDTPPPFQITLHLHPALDPSGIGPSAFGLAGESLQLMHTTLTTAPRVQCKRSLILLNFVVIDERSV